MSLSESVRRIRVEPRRLFFKGGEQKAPRPNRQHIFGIEFSYDDDGRVTETRHLDRNGITKADISGVSIRATKWTSAGELVEQRNLDAAGRLVDNNSGFAQVSFASTDSQEVIRYFSAAGLPTLDVTGDSSLIVKRNSIGQITDIYNADPAGKVIEDEFGVASEHLAYDEYGYPSRFSTLDIDGKPTSVYWEAYDSTNEPGYVLLGCEAIHSLRSPDGTLLEHSCNLANGTPVIGRSGWHVEILEHTARGQISSQTTWGVNREPVNCRLLSASDALTWEEEEDVPNICPHKMQVTWNASGRLAERRFFDINGDPTVNDSGVHRWTQQYDGSGNANQELYFDEKGKPAFDRYGCYGYESQFTEYGQTSEDYCLDETGRRALSDKGYSGFAIQYNERGYAIKRTFHDTKGDPQVDGDGIAGYQRVVGPAGTLLAHKYLALDGTFTTDSTGAHGFRLHYDEFGRADRVERIDEKDRVVPSGNGYASQEVVSFNRKGEVVSWHLVHLDDQAILFDGGHVGARDTLDSYGRTYERRFFDSAGQPATDETGNHGWTAKHDERGNRIEVVYRDKAWLPHAASSAIEAPIGRSMFDQFDRPIRLQYFSDSEVPYANSEGISATELKYDRFSRTTAELRFDANGQLAENDEGDAVREYVRDRFGRITETRFIDDAGNLASISSYAVLKNEYDSFGREHKRQFYNTLGKPVSHPNSGRFEVNFKYDSKGRKIEETSFDESGSPVNRRDLGWHRQVTKYDGLSSAGTVTCWTIDKRRLVDCKID